MATPLRSAKNAHAAQENGSEPLPAKARLSGRPSGAHPRALVVEIDPGTREICAAVLGRLGIVADIVDNGVAAVSLARQKSPDIVIAALQLRDSRGTEVIEWLRSNPALVSTPVLLLTTDAKDVSKSKSWAVDAVLTKPTSPETLRDAIRRAIGTGRSRKDGQPGASARARGKT